MAETQDWERTWGQVVSQAWTDDSFRQRLISDPRGALEERGLTPPPGAKITVLEDTADTVHVVLPARPDALSDEDLDAAAGGAGAVCEHACWCTR